MKRTGLFLLLVAALGAQEPAVKVHLPPWPARPAAPVLAEWQRQAIAACLVLEAACQGEAGMRAVMAVVHNRARGRPAHFATEVLRPRQFSALNEVTQGQVALWRLVQRAQRDLQWSAAERLVAEACAPTWDDPTAGATHYTRSSERPAWARSMQVTVRIGAHVFYRKR